MKVTPRVPVHGNFQTYAEFVEMRYFRCGEKSFLTAFLFGLFEAARLPGSHHLRVTLRDGITKMDTKLQKPAVFLLNTNVPSEDFLAAWNCCEYILMFANAAVDQVVLDYEKEASCKMDVISKILHVEIVRAAERRSRKPGMIQLFFDSFDDGTVLLYPKYAMDSFVVTPCMHLNLKYELFAQARRCMNFPQNRTQFETNPILCQDESCRRLVSNFVFEIGKSESSVPSLGDSNRINQLIYSPVVRPLPDDSITCLYCCEREGDFQCSRGDSLCKFCAAAVCFTESQLLCPVCGSVIMKEMLDFVIAEANKVQGARRSPEAIVCYRCG